MFYVFFFTLCRVESRICISATAVVGSKPILVIAASAIHPKL